MTVVDEAARITAGVDGTGRPGGMAYRAVLPTVVEAVVVARRFAAAVAAGCAHVGEAELEAELLVSELASCALRCVGAGSGTFSVAAIHRPGLLRLEVETCGSGWWPGCDRDDELAYGLALRVVAGLADRFGHAGTSAGVAVLWAELALGGRDQRQGHAE